ncbi:MAG: prepilin-type N-terminal cleavage/methylation domain-containing protein [Phycisphaerales bacterium]
MFAERRRRRRRAAGVRGQRGFTLIETIGALVILAIALPPMMAAIRKATLARVQPTMFSHARWLATEKLEDIIADRYSATRGYDYVENASYPTENPIPTDPAFRRAVNIVETGADLQSAGDGYKTVTVTLTWTDATGVQRDLDISTVLTEWTP